MTVRSRSARPAAPRERVEEPGDNSGTCKAVAVLSPPPGALPCNDNERELTYPRPGAPLEKLR